MDPPNAWRHLLHGCMLTCWLLSGQELHGQVITITVVDSVSNLPLAAALAEIHGPGSGRRAFMTDSLGIVSIAHVDLSREREVTIQRLGYYPVTFTVSLDAPTEHVVRMQRNPVQLGAISVDGRHPYQILNPSVDNLYARRVGRRRPGARIFVRGDELFESIHTVEDLRRTVFRTSRNPGCRGPLWFLNGFAYSHIPWGEDLETISLSLLEGVEFFMDPTDVPAEYWRGGSECGVIALWSRVQ